MPLSNVFREISSALFQSYLVFSNHPDFAQEMTNKKKMVNYGLDELLSDLNGKYLPIAGTVLTKSFVAKVGYTSVLNSYLSGDVDSISQSANKAFGSDHALRQHFPKNR